MTKTEIVTKAALMDEIIKIKTGAKTAAEYGLPKTVTEDEMINAIVELALTLSS
jgi:hypothetical protein